MKTSFITSSHVRQQTATITDADDNDVALFEIPSHTRVLGFVVGVSDAFNTSAKLALGTVADSDGLVAAQAIDALGSFFVNMAEPYKTTDEPVTILATVSDKSAVGSAAVTVLFAMDIDVGF